MLKYLNYDVVCQEVPGQLSLAVSISGCLIRCKGCHSRQLWEDKGTPLTIENIEELLKQENGVTCLLLMGGERDIDTLTEIFMHFHKKIKTAWYCGLDWEPNEKVFKSEDYHKLYGMLYYLDFLKTGHFDIELGGLNSPTTNQKYFMIDPVHTTYQDITYIFQKQNKKENNEN
jgi:anaerobic ribonucleoside-triphosphate reductase activating protein